MVCLDPEFEFCSSNFRFLNEIHYHWCVARAGTAVSEQDSLSLQERQGQANRACCTTSPTTHVRCLLLYGVSVSGCLTVKDHSQHTIGVEFSSRTVKLGEKRIKLQVCHSLQ
jgi:hypothetical protein